MQGGAETAEPGEVMQSLHFELSYTCRAVERSVAQENLFLPPTSNTHVVSMLLFLFLWKTWVSMVNTSSFSRRLTSYPKKWVLGARVESDFGFGVNQLRCIDAHQ